MRGGGGGGGGGALAGPLTVPMGEQMKTMRKCSFLFVCLFVFFFFFFFLFFFQESCCRTYKRKMVF